MAERKLGCAVVMEDGDVVGIFTIVDALRALSRVLAAGQGSNLDVADLVIALAAIRAERAVPGNCFGRGRTELMGRMAEPLLTRADFTLPGAKLEGG